MSGKPVRGETAEPHDRQGSVGMVKAELLEPQRPNGKAIRPRNGG
jgi:hypothetical protein